MPLGPEENGLPIIDDDDEDEDDDDSFVVEFEENLEL